MIFKHVYLINQDRVDSIRFFNWLKDIGLNKTLSKPILLHLISFYSVTSAVHAEICIFYNSPSVIIFLSF